MTAPAAPGTAAGPPDAVAAAPRRRPPGGAGRRWAAAGVIVAAVGFLLFQAVGDATVYFKTADEAVAERAELGDRRFRLEGLVVPGSVRKGADEVDFTVRGQEGAEVEVVHEGNVPELFQPDIPVVMEGHFVGSRYVSDRILVKHTSEYRAENPDRVEEYDTPG